MPPTIGHNKSQTDAKSVRSERSELDLSFDLPMPSMPAPPLPFLSGSHDPTLEGPPPPPRVDSFESAQDSIEEPISPFLLTLPPAPPLPLSNQEEAPPLPQRPTSKLESNSNQTTVNAPPVLPPRTLTAANASVRPPIPPRRSAQ